MKVFVTGGTGFVGRYLVKELLVRGHAVRVLVHSRGLESIAGAEQVEGDVTCQEDVVAASRGCDALIHLVGIIREFPRRGVTFERLHVKATENALSAAQANGIRRYVHMSALGTRPEAVSGYHRTKYRAEEIVRASGLDATVFRPSLIYGPGDAFVAMLASHMRLSPIMPVIGTGQYRLQPIHVEDVARCFVMALDMPETVGQCYELCGNDRLTYDELLDKIAEAMGRAKPLKPRLPLGIMKCVIPALQSLPHFPITADQLQMLLEESVCDGTWKQTYKFEPRCFSDAISEYLRQK